MQAFQVSVKHVAKIYKKTIKRFQDRSERKLWRRSYTKCPHFFIAILLFFSPFSRLRKKIFCEYIFRDKMWRNLGDWIKVLRFLCLRGFYVCIYKWYKTSKAQAIQTHWIFRWRMAPTLGGLYFYSLSYFVDTCTCYTSFIDDPIPTMTDRSLILRGYSSRNIALNMKRENILLFLAASTVFWQTEYHLFCVSINIWRFTKPSKNCTTIRVLFC